MPGRPTHPRPPLLPVNSAPCASGLYKEAGPFPSEPIYASSLPCFKCTKIALWMSTFFFFACRFYVSSLGLLLSLSLSPSPSLSVSLSLACCFQPRSLMLPPWTTLAASTVGVLLLWFGFFFLQLLPRSPPAAKAALVPACIT